LYVRNLLLLTILKFLFFSPTLHFPLLKSLFSRSLIIETRQDDSLATQVHGDIKRSCVLVSLLPSHLPSILVQLPEVLQLLVKRYLRYLSSNGLYIPEFSPLRQPASPFVELCLMEILDYSLEMNQDCCQPIRVDHQVGQFELGHFG